MTLTDRHADAAAPRAPRVEPPRVVSRLSRALGFTSQDRNSIYLLAASLVGGATGLLFWLVAARTASPPEVGVAGALLSLASLLALVSGLGLPQVLPRALPRSAEGPGIVSAALLLSLVVGAAGALVTLGIAPLVAPELAAARAPVTAALFVALAASFSVFYSATSVLTAAREGFDVLRMHLIYNLAKLALVVALAGAILLSWLLGLLLAVAAGLAWWLPRAVSGWWPGAGPRWAALAPWRREAAENLAASALRQGGTLLLPALVVAAIDAENAAYFFLVLQLTTALYAAPDAAAQSYFAEVSRPAADGRRLLARALRLVAALLALGLAGLALAGPFVLGLLGEGYARAAPALYVLLASAPFFAVVTLGATIARHQDRRAEMMLMLALPTLVILAGMPLAGPRGLVAVAALVVAAQAAGALAAVPSFYRELRKTSAAPAS